MRLLVLIAGLCLAFAAPASAVNPSPPTHYRSVAVDGINIFYREAGKADAPVLLLLHGYPGSSFVFRDLIPLLAARYHVIAPDYPGFGFSDVPDRSQFTYSFGNLTKVMLGFTQALKLDRYALYGFDYGAPISLRMALAHPERVTAFITQNGVAHEAGFSPAFAGFVKLDGQPPEAARTALRGLQLLSAAAVKSSHVYGMTDPTRVAPESYALESAALARAGNDEIQYDLMLDYGSNVALYPQFQDWLRTRRPPLLVLWGKNDRLFPVAGAEAFRNDAPKAEIHLYDTGHFALTTHVDEIAGTIHGFMKKHVR